MSLKTTGLMISIGAVFTGASALSATTTAIGKLETSIKKIEKNKTNLKVNSKEYELANKRVGVLNQSLEKLRINQAKIETNTLKMNEFENSIGKRLALAATIVAPIKLAIDFESSMADVKKVVDFSSKEEAKKFETKILDLSTQIPINATGLATIVASGGQLGIAKDKLLEFTQITAKMSTAFDMSTQEAGESSATLMNVFRLNINQMESLGDALNHLSDNSASRAKDLIEVLAKVGGSSSIIGLSAKQTSSLASAFLSMGKPVAVTGTAINSILTTLGNATGQGAKFENALGLIGLSANELKENISQDAQGTIVDFLNRLNDIEQSEKLGILTDLFGVGYADDVALLTQGMQNYTDAIELLNDKQKYQGSMEKEFQVRSNTTANNFILLSNSISKLGISLGTSLLPIISFSVKALSSIANIVGTFVTSFPKVSAVFSSFVAGAIGISVILPTLGYAWFFVHNGILKFSSMLKIVTTLLRVNSTITAICIATTKIWTFFKNLATSSLKRFNLATIATTISSKLYMASLSLGTITTKAFSTTTLFLSKAFNIAKLSLRSFLGATGIGLLLVGAGLIYEYWKPIKTFFLNFWDSIKIGFKDGINAVLTIFISPIEIITNIWNNLFSFIGKGTKWIKDIGLSIGSFFGIDSSNTALAIAKVPQMQLQEKPISSIASYNTIPNAYNISINVNNPSSNVEVEKAVKKAIENINRDKFNRGIN